MNLPSPGLVAPPGGEGGGGGGPPGSRAQAAIKVRGGHED